MAEEKKLWRDMIPPPHFLKKHDTQGKKKCVCICISKQFETRVLNVCVCVYSLLVTGRTHTPAAGNNRRTKKKYIAALFTLPYLYLPAPALGYDIRKSTGIFQGKILAAAPDTISASFAAAAAAALQTTTNILVRLDDTAPLIKTLYPQTVLNCLWIQRVYLFSIVPEKKTCCLHKKIYSEQCVLVKKQNEFFGELRITS